MPKDGLPPTSESALIKVLLDPKLKNQSFQEVAKKRQNVFGAPNSALRTKVGKRRTYLLTNPDAFKRAVSSFLETNKDEVEVEDDSEAAALASSVAESAAVESPSVDESFASLRPKTRTPNRPSQAVAPTMSEEEPPQLEVGKTFPYDLDIYEPWNNPESILCVVGDRSYIDGNYVGTRINVYVPVICIQDYHNKMYKAFFSKCGRYLSILKPGLVYYQARRAGYIQDSEDPEHQCPKVREQHQIIASTANRAEGKKKLIQELKFKLPDDMKGTNKYYNPPMPGTELNTRLRTIGIRYNKNGKVSDSVHFFFVISFHVIGTKAPVNDDDTNTKEEDEIARLLGGTLRFAD